MLLKSKITDITILSDAWYQTKLAKFSSSEIYNLCGEKPFTIGAMSYIYRKVGEELSGLPAKEDIDTTATRHGNLYEIDGIQKAAQQQGKDFLVVQKLICDPSTRFGSTPDCLDIISESTDKLSWQVEPWEIKCPLTYDNYIKLALCNSPLEVKRAEVKYYWQLLDQLDNCDSLKGKLVIYHPHFKAGGLKIIPFRIMEQIEGKYPMKSDLDLLRQRKLMAVDKFNEVREKLLNI